MQPQASQATSSEGTPSPGVIRDDRGVPTSIRLFKPGHNLASNPGDKDVVYDPADGPAIVADNNRADGRIYFDLNHDSVFETGDKTKSYGDGKLRADQSGVWVDEIRWTPDGLKHLLLGEYRHISPTFKKREVEGEEVPRLAGVLCVALVNAPATKQAEAIMRGDVAAVKKVAVKKAPRRIPKDNTMSTADNAEDLATKRGSTDDGTEGKDDDNAWDGADADIEGMDTDALREFAAKAMDRIRDLEGEDEDSEDEDDKDEEDEKRSTVTEAWKTGRINFVEKSRLMKLRLADVRKELKSAPATKQRKHTERPTHSNPNAFAAPKRPAGMPGLSDKELTNALRSYGLSEAEMSRHGLTQDVPGAIWGARIDSYRKN